MKRKIKLLLIVVAVIPGAVFARKLAPEVERAMAYGAEAKICLKVHDDTGQPISNASVAVVFDMLPSPHSVYGKTDANGVCVAIGKTNGNKVRFLVGKEGYYGSQKEVSYVTMNAEHDVKAGKWQPYAAEEVIVLRAIRHPAKLASELFWNFKYTKSINKWIGYDIQENDFVAPDGKGKIADFEVYIDWNGEWLPAYRGMAVKIRFAEPLCGYYTYDINQASEFKYPYEAAPDLVDSTGAEFSERILDDGRRIQKHFDLGKCWVVRSRCKVSPDGRLLSANYSVIYDIVFTCKRGGYGGFCVTGAFNPTPNDTNLEDEEIAKQSRHFIRHCEPPGKGNLK